MFANLIPCLSQVVVCSTSLRLEIDNFLPFCDQKWNLEDLFWDFSLIRYILKMQSKPYLCYGKTDNRKNNCNKYIITKSSIQQEN